MKSDLDLEFYIFSAHLIPYKKVYDVITSVQQTEQKSYPKF